MTPKRFKAVCTETGREFFPDRQGLDENSPPWLERKTRNLYCWAVHVWIPVGHTNIELCQSTGLTDSRGQEVYEGDVTFSPSGFGYQMVVSFFDGAFMVTPHRDWAFEKDLPPDYLSKHIKDHVVIGNRWMPQAELQARAEAVSNEL